MKFVPVELTLFGAPGCHLCDEAKMILSALERKQLVVITHVNAHGSFELVQSMGHRIPVIRLPDGQEINWPFTESDIRKAIETRPP